MPNRPILFHFIYLAFKYTFQPIFFCSFSISFIKKNNNNNLSLFYLLLFPKPMFFKFCQHLQFSNLKFTIVKFFHNYIFCNNNPFLKKFITIWKILIIWKQSNFQTLKIFLWIHIFFSSNVSHYSLLLIQIYVSLIQVI